MENVLNATVSAVADTPPLGVNTDTVRTSTSDFVYRGRDCTLSFQLEKTGRSFDEAKVEVVITVESPEYKRWDELVVTIEQLTDIIGQPWATPFYEPYPEKFLQFLYMIIDEMLRRNELEEANAVEVAA